MTTRQPVNQVVTRVVAQADARGMTLGTFLRMRRENLTPAKAGIGAKTRRRTPGLRREEVAVLSEISPEWYTYLEQDRNVRPSYEVIERIAAALQLSPAERKYIHTLAFPKERGSPVLALPTSLQRFLDDLEYRPAYVVNDFWDLVGWNAAAAALFPGLKPEAHPNLVTSVFLNSGWRTLYADWEQSARTMLSLFRLTVATHAGHERCSRLIEELGASSEFTKWWQQQNVSAVTAGTKRMIHPVEGLIELDYSSFRTLEDPAVTVIAFRPCDAESKQKLQRLVAL